MSAPAEPKRLAKPVDWDELYPGRFLKASDLKGQRVTVTIYQVDLEELEGDTGKMTKGVISFKGKEKMMALNRTNGLCLKAMFGKKVQEWSGKRVTLMPTETKFGAETVDAIRIYGSPDISKDVEIALKLPKKRPVQVTLHRVDPPGQRQPPAKAEPRTDAPPGVDWLARLKAAETLQALEAVWSEALVAHKDRAPVELDDAYQNRREQLSELAARQDL